MIAVQQVQQLQKLRELQMGAASRRVRVHGYAQQNDSAKEAILKSWIDSQGRLPFP